MKFLQVLLLVCVAVCYIEADEIDIEKLEAIVKECQDENKASDDDVKLALKMEASNNKAEKCLRACFLHKTDILDATNHLNVEKSLKLLHIISHGDEEKENVGIAAVEACKDIEIPEDRCEAAEKYITCSLEFNKGKDSPSFEDYLASRAAASK